MLDRFQLSENYQFFKVVKPVSEAAIKRCLNEASEDKKGYAVDRSVRAVKRIGRKQFYASHIVFRTELSPSFLVRGAERDVKHCYALIIEYGDYLIVSRSGGKNFLEILKDNVEKVNPIILNAAFLQASSTIKKASARNTTLSRSALKTITYEGNELENNMPVQGVSGRMLNSFKHETRGELYSITGNQAKVNISNSKVSIQVYLARVLTSIEKFGKRQKGNAFLANFAKPLSLKQHVNKIIPSEILFSTSELRDYVESKDGSLPRLFYRKGKVVKYLKPTFNEFIDSVENSFEINRVGPGINKKYFISNSLDNELHLLVSASGYDLGSEKFSNIWLEYTDGETENLQRLINRKNLFSLSFNKFDINYVNGQLYQDSKLLGNLDGFLQMFIPRTEMNLITSEKGSLIPTATSFQAGTCFEFVESDFMPALDHLVLDDLGYENADYIGVKHLSKVQLIHCKASRKVFSASAFQEIVGQALKNLHFFLHPEVIDYKKDYWGELYLDSNIRRNRTNKRTVIGELKATMQATNCDKEVYLIVNFISKQLLTDNLNRVKKGQPAPRATLPMLWLLNSLRNVCLERNVKVYIICKP